MSLVNKYFFWVGVFGCIAVVSTASNADEIAWKNSYQMESEGKYLEAISAVDQTASTGFDAELKYLRRGWLFYSLGKFDESIRDYRLAAERNKNSVDARLGATLPLLALKRWREAEQNARAALVISPNSYTALLRLTIALEGQHDWVNMEKTAGIMAAVYPSDASSYVYLARADAWLNKKNEAAIAYAAVLSRFPGHLEAKAYLEKK